MKVLVTGSSGFLGRSVVAKCTEAGHKVLALVRPNATTEVHESDQVELVRGDLRQRAGWTKALEGVEAVIHAAAAPTGDLPEQFAGTVIGTENLLACLPPTVRRFVHVSSFSVYDFCAIGVGNELDEQSVIETHAKQRDAYTWTKLTQEKLVVDHCRERALPLVVIRPGAIFGTGKDWDFGRAIRLGGIDLMFAPFGQMRLTYVDNCADAIVRGLELPAAGGTFNIVDADPPTHAAYHRLCRRAGARAGRAVHVPWIMVAAAGFLVRAVNRTFFGGRARLPEILDYPRQQARWKPLHYSNDRAVRELGWTPTVSIGEGVLRMFANSSLPSNQALAKKSRRKLKRGEVTFGLPEAIVLAALGVATAVIAVVEHS